MQQYTLILSNNGRKRRRGSTKGLGVMIHWGNGSMTWDSMKEEKKLFLLQLAEYFFQRQISQEPVFACCLPHVMKNNN